MNKIKCNYLLKVISILLTGLFTVNSGRATSPAASSNPIFARIGDSELEPKKIGEQILIPIQIF